MKKLLFWAGFALLIAGLLLALPLAVLWYDLPSHHGRTNLPGLSKEVTVEWDPEGVPTVHADGLKDALVAQGYVTARDRFFQMDLIRRKMAGRLSEIVGPATLALDRDALLYGYSHAADGAIEKMALVPRADLEAYAEGVNAYLRQQPRPWEMLVLGYKPEAWKPRDSILVVLSMYESLNDYDDPSEEVIALLRKTFSSEVIRFLTPEWGFLDAPILPDPKSLPLPVPPSPAALSVRNIQSRLSLPEEKFERGSNAWVISGKLTRSGRPILASDPHLDLALPNIWYRTRLVFQGRELYGVTIPGIPEIVIGRNKTAAWAFTNSAIDNADQVEIPLDEKGEPLFEGQPGRFKERLEEIPIKGAPPEKLAVQESPWGPVIQRNERTAIALQWEALDPSSLSAVSLEPLTRAETVEQLMAAFADWAGPAQNAVFATRSGDIGWTIAGQLPKRVGFDGLARGPRDKSHYWDGGVPHSRFPKLVNPESGYIVSANQRSVGVGPDLPLFGSHWPSPARARRIADLLSRGRQWNADEVHRIQNDNTSLTHIWYRDELLSCPVSDKDAELKAWLEVIGGITRSWDGRTSANSAAYPLLKEFRSQLFQKLIGPIAGAIATDKKEIILKRLSKDALVYSLLKTQPKNLLPAPYEDYCQALQQGAKAAGLHFAKTPAELHRLHWGHLNRAKIHHPLSSGLPSTLARWLDAPPIELAGDNLVPRVMTPKEGASMQLVIDLGAPEESLFVQPGGQSGHPLSPHYQDLFSHWASGHPHPFGPGRPAESEVFEPHV